MTTYIKSSGQNIPLGFLSAPWTDVNNYPSLTTAIASMSGGTLLIANPTILSSNTTIPSNINVIVIEPGLINLSGHNLAINGPCDFPLAQVFSGSGNVTFGVGAVLSVKPEWWGITGTNDEIAINNAIQSLGTIGGAVKLSSRTYFIQTNTINTKENVALIGCGADAYLGIHGTWLWTSLANQGCITIIPGTFNLKFIDFGIGSTTLTTGQYGVEAKGAFASSPSQRIRYEGISFWNMDKGVYIHPSDGGQVDFNTVQDCRADQGNRVFEIDTQNSNWKFQGNNYFNYLDTAIYLDHVGSVNIKNTFGGTTNASGNFIYVNVHGTIAIETCQQESAGYFLYSPASASDPGHSINLTGNIIDTKLYVGNQKTIISKGNRFDGANPVLVSCILISEGDYFLSPYHWDLTGGAYASIIGAANAAQNPDGFIQQSPAAAVASSSTITPTGALFHVTGTSAITTINVPWPGFSGRITIIPDGIFTWNATGNIAIAGSAITVGQSIDFYFDWIAQKWYPIFSSANLYGQMWYHNDSAPYTIALTTGTPAQIACFDTASDGQTLNGFSYSTSALTCLVAGTYKVNYSQTMGSSTSNHIYRTRIAINGVEQLSTASHTKPSNSTDERASSGCAIISLNVNDVVTIQMTDTTAGNSTATLFSLNVNLDRIGN